MTEGAIEAGSLFARERIVRSTGRESVDWLIKEVDYRLAIEVGSLVARERIVRSTDREGDGRKVDHRIVDAFVAGSLN